VIAHEAVRRGKIRNGRSEMATMAQEHAASMVRSWLFDVEDRLTRISLDLRENAAQVESPLMMERIRMLGDEMRHVPSGVDISELVIYVKDHGGA
jgi:hypothetical protein